MRSYLRPRRAPPERAEIAHREHDGATAYDTLPQGAKGTTMAENNAHPRRNSKPWTLSVAGRIYGLIAFAIVCQAGGIAYQLDAYRDGIWEERRHELRNLTALAVSIVNAEQAAVEAGQKTLEAAQASAKSRVKALRYNGS